MTQTSLFAFQEMKTSGKITAHQRIILKALRDSPGCNREISNRSDLDYHQVARRTKELLEKGLISIKTIEKKPFSRTPVMVFEIVKDLFNDN